MAQKPVSLPLTPAVKAVLQTLSDLDDRLTDVMIHIEELQPLTERASYIEMKEAIARAKQP